MVGLGLSPGGFYTRSTGSACTTTSLILYILYEANIEIKKIVSKSRFFTECMLSYRHMIAS